MVSGGIDNISDYRGHEIGKYSYEIIPNSDVACLTCLPVGHTIRYYIKYKSV